MLSIANEVDLLIFLCVCFVCDTIYVFPTSKTLNSLDLSSEYMWVYAKTVENPWHVS